MMLQEKLAYGQTPPPSGNPFADDAEQTDSSGGVDEPNTFSATSFGNRMEQANVAAVDQPAAPPPLPQGWTEVVDDGSGEKYYL